MVLDMHMTIFGRGPPEQFIREAATVRGGWKLPYMWGEATLFHNLWYSFKLLCRHCTIKRFKNMFQMPCYLTVTGPFASHNWRPSTCKEPPDLPQAFHIFPCLIHASHAHDPPKCSQYARSSGAPGGWSLIYFILPTRSLRSIDPPSSVQCPPAKCSLSITLRD